MLTLVIMTNISKNNINAPDFQAVQKQLIEHIAKLTKQNASALITNLLTDTEQIMIVKRYGAIFMYTQKYSPYRVSHTLGISQPTACRLYTQYQDGQFDDLMSTLKKKEKNQFLARIEDLIMAQVNTKARARLTR